MTNELISSKYTFACDPDECDCLIEVTSSDGFGFPSGVVEITCPCGRKPNLLSVQHATIQPTNERNTMETENTVIVPEHYNANQLVTYKAITDGVATYPTIKVNDLEWQLQGYRTDKGELRRLRSSIDGLDEQIVEWYKPNYDKEDVIRELCEYFGINPTKTLEAEVQITVNVQIEVPLDECEDFDVADFARDNITVDSNDGQMDVTDWSVEDVNVL
jgi:hypothetical protein